MNMDYLLKEIFALLASIFVSGCDQRHVVEDNLKPFSFIGVQLGMAKKEAAGVRTIGSCRPEGIDEATCSIGSTEEKYRFFGISVENGSVSLFKPYSQISPITFNTKWDILQKKVVETAWGLQGRCFVSAADSRGMERTRGINTSRSVHQLDQSGVALCQSRGLCIVLPIAVRNASYWDIPPALNNDRMGIPQRTRRILEK